MHGQFVWYELTTPDIDAAKRFYQPITGWGTQQFGEDYTMWTSGGKPFAGIFRLGPDQRQQGIPPNWMPYVEANNIDETARVATSLGGTVMHGPEDIPGTGRFAVIADPQGAVFGIYKANGPSQAWNGTPSVGRFSWHELMTTDSAKAFEFYRKLFGWDKTGEMDMGGGNMYRMYGKGQPFGGMFNRTPEMGGMRPFWLCYIYVKDVKKAVDAAVKGGAMVQRPPMEIPGGGTIAILGDPQGAAFAVHAGPTSASAGRPAAKKAATKAAKKATKKVAAKKSRPKAKKAAKKRPAAKKSARKAGAKKSKRRR